MPPIMDRVMWWEKPCEDFYPIRDVDFKNPIPVVDELSDAQFLNILMITCHDALSAVDDFKFQYISESVLLQDKEASSWPMVTSNWRPKFHVNKELAVPSEPPDFMVEFYYDDFIADSFRYLQLIAVALEQMEYDHRRLEISFLDKEFFAVTYYRMWQRIRIVACILYNHMEERGIWKYPTYQRHYLDDRLREVTDPVERRLRDWIFLRDAMLTMEYILVLTDYFIKNKDRTDSGNWRQNIDPNTVGEGGRIPPLRRKKPIDMNGPMWWDNPCDAHEHVVHNSGYEEPDPLDQITDTQLLESVAITAHNAVKSVEEFKYQFVQQTFHIDYETFHNQWKHVKHWWMPMINVDREKDKPLTGKQMENMKFDDFICDAFRFLQISAVALEQVEYDYQPTPYDMSEYNNEFYTEMFRRLRQRARMVMCELWTTIREREMWPHETQTREVMPEYARTLSDGGDRNMRDWIILRDTIAAMELVMEVSNYFRDHIELLDRSKWSGKKRHPTTDPNRPVDV